MDSLKFIAVGNSFSEDTLAHFHALAKSAGIENVRVYNLYIGGCTIDRHVKNARGELGEYQLQINTDGEWRYEDGVTLRDGLTREKWDFVSFQQMSSAAGMPETFDKLPELVGYVRAIVGDEPEFVWNMTWAYSADFVGEEFELYGSDQLRMYSRIVSAARKRVFAFEKIAEIVPVGTAIQNARTSHLGDTMCRDTRHLSYDVGRYIAGLAMLAQIAELDPADVPYMPDGVDAAVRTVAVESVNNALCHPYEITQSQYKKRA